MVPFLPKDQTSEETIKIRMDNVRANCQLDLPWFEPSDVRRRVVAACPGPSLKDNQGKMRKMIKGAELWAVNGAYGWLLDRGLIPDVMVLCDAKPNMLEFIKKTHDKTVFYIASQCHPDVFKALEGKKVYLWHAYLDGIEDYLKDEQERPCSVIHGGGTVGLKAMYLAYLRGSRQIDYYGLDGSIANGDLHVNGAEYIPDREQCYSRTYDVVCAGREFKIAEGYASQAPNFVSQIELIPDCKVRAHGDGLIPHISKILQAQLRQPTGVSHG